MTTSATPRHRRLPRVATLTAIAALTLAFVVVAWSLPIDDFWVSLASGRAILHGADPGRAVPLTWLPSLPGAINPQWGSELILSAVDSLGWALAVNAALLAVGLLLTLERVRHRVPPTAAAVAFLMVLAVLSVHLLARAQSFSIALFPLALICLERLRGRWWQPVALGLLTAAWANLHGAFVVGQLAAVCFFLGAGWDWWRSHEPSGARVTAVYGATAVAVLISALANPVGTRLLGYAYGQGTSDLVRAISVEWQPSWPWEPVGLLFWLLAAAVLAGRLIRRPGASTAEILIAIGTGILAASGIRHIPWFVLAVAPLLAGDVAALLKARPLLARAFGEIQGPLSGPRASSLLLGFGVLAVAFQPLRPALPASVARITPDEPVTVAAALRPRLVFLSERVLNEQVWGGYLEWALRGQAVPAIDGRIEIRSRDTWQRYFDLMGGTGPVASQLAAANVHWALLSPGRTVLISALTSAGWETVTTQPNAVLLHRP